MPPLLTPRLRRRALRGRMSVNTQVEQLDFAAPPVVRQWHVRALIAAGVFSVAAIAGAVLNPAQALHSYLVGFMLILGLSLGPLGLLMVWHLTGGGWGVGIRRILEAAVASLPLVILAFIPLLLGLQENYKWARPEVLAQSEHIRQLAEKYLNFRFFLGRAIAYFLSWGALAFFLLKWSRMEERGAGGLGSKYRALSAPGLVLYFWTITFAIVDWVMSAAVPWMSTIYALIFAIGQGMIGLCLTVLVARALRREGRMREVLKPDNFHDYGKLMLMFVMIWAWFNFSQWLLIWSGNLPEEIRFYIDRSRGGWENVVLLLVFGYFAVPFALLLSRGLKKDPNRLARVAAWLIFMRYVDLYWNIAPNYSPEHFHYSWLDAVVPLAMFALWLTFFFWNMQRKPLVSVNDPNYQKFLEPHHG